MADTHFCDISDFVKAITDETADAVCGVVSAMGGAEAAVHAVAPGA